MRKRRKVEENSVMFCTAVGFWEEVCRMLSEKIYNLFELRDDKYVGQASRAGKTSVSSKGGFGSRHPRSSQKGFRTLVRDS